MAHARVLLIGALVVGVVSGTAGAQPIEFPIDPTSTVTFRYGDVNPLGGGTASGSCLFAGNRHWNRFGFSCPNLAGGNPVDEVLIFDGQPGADGSRGPLWQSAYTPPNAMYVDNMPSDALHTLEQGNAYVELHSNGSPEAGGSLDQSDAFWASFQIQDLGEGGPATDVMGRCDAFTIEHRNGNFVLVTDCERSIVGNTTAHLHAGPTNASPLDLDLSDGILPNGGLFEIDSIISDLIEDLRRPNGSNILDFDFPNGAVVGGGPDPCVTTPNTGCTPDFHSVTVQATSNGPLYELVEGGGSSGRNVFHEPDGEDMTVTIISDGAGGGRVYAFGRGGELITVTDVGFGTVQEFTVPADGFLSEPL